MSLPCFSLLDPPRILTLEEPVLHMDHCIAFAVHGNPAPTLHWLHNGQVLRETEIIRMEFYQQGEVSEGCLLFNKPTHYNNGNYTIVATNQLGSANQTIKGHFLEKPFPGRRFNLSRQGSLQSEGLTMALPVILAPQQGLDNPSWLCLNNRLEEVAGSSFDQHNFPTKVYFGVI